MFFFEQETAYEIECGQVCTEMCTSGGGKSGTRTAWPRVVGVAVEKAFKVADASHGVGALRPDDLGGFVVFIYVKWRGPVEAGLFTHPTLPTILPAVYSVVVAPVSQP